MTCNLSPAVWRRGPVQQIRDPNQRHDVPPILRHLRCPRSARPNSTGISSSRETEESWVAIRPSSPTLNSSQVCRFAAGSTFFAARSPTACDRTSATTFAICAMPRTSRINATSPSPMMVAPAKQASPFSCLPSGFTTISSVSLISSTTSPNCRSSALQHHDIDHLRLPVLVRGVRRGQPQFTVQVHQRQQVAAQPINRELRRYPRCWRLHRRPPAAPAPAG